MNVLQKCAEILVESGKAIRWRNPVDPKFTGIIMVLTEADVDGDYGEFNEWCNPFADTLEGRRQADAIEDWLDSYKSTSDVDGLSMWEVSAMTVMRDSTHHQYRLDRIKWCISELCKDGK